MTPDSAAQPPSGPPSDGPPSSGPPRYDAPHYAPPNYGPPQSGPENFNNPDYGPRYGQEQQYPALQGAAPASAGLQIAAKLVEAVLIAIPVVVLSMLAVIPFIFAIVAAADYDTGTARGSAGENPLMADVGMIFAAFITIVGVILLIWLLLSLALVWWLAVRGGSFGNAIFGLRLVSTETGQPIGWGKSLLWYVVVIVGTVVTGGILGLLFLLSPLFDSASGWNQAWQDKMVGAVLINTRMGRDTFPR